MKSICPRLSQPYLSMNASLRALYRSRGYTFSLTTLAVLATALLMDLLLRAHGQGTNSYTSSQPPKDSQKDLTPQELAGRIDLLKTFQVAVPIC
jgi:hypothetical protein